LIGAILYGDQSLKASEEGKEINNSSDRSND
jgi:hypothetical protein